MQPLPWKTKVAKTGLQVEIASFVRGGGLLTMRGFSHFYTLVANICFLNPWGKVFLIATGSQSLLLWMRDILSGWMQQLFPFTVVSKTSLTVGLSAIKRISQSNFLPSLYLLPQIPPHSTLSFCLTVEAAKEPFLCVTFCGAGRRHKLHKCLKLSVNYYSMPP